MFRSIVNTARKLWADDAGSVIATEYLALGSIVGLGTIAGLQAMRDATNDEMREYGNSVRSFHQHYQVPSNQVGNNVKAGSAASDNNSTLACP